MREIQKQSLAESPILRESCTLLLQLIDLSLQQEAATCDSLDQFISDSVAIVRQSCDVEEVDEHRLEAMIDDAVETWGDQIACEVEADSFVGNASEPASTSILMDFDPATAEPLCAPSAIEIQSLMQQLGPADETTARIEHDETTNDGVDDDKDDTADFGSRFESKHRLDLDALNPEFIEAFLADATSCLGAIESALLKLECSSRDPDALRRIMRELHTLKGAAASIGLSHLASYIHHLEDQLRQDQRSGEPSDTNGLLKSVDRIRDSVGQVHDSKAARKSGGPANGQVCDSATTTNGANDSSSVNLGGFPLNFADDGADDEMVRVKASQLNRLMDALAELVSLRNQRESEIAELQTVYREMLASVAQMRLLRGENEIIHSERTSLQLSEVANDVMEAAQLLKRCVRPFADANSTVSRSIGQLRQELVQLRRSPISGLFRRLQRVVRDAAHAEEKQVRLELIGQEAGIERNLQQKLYEPLLHIVRNSVCHGIEDPATRDALGKNSEGCVTITAKSSPGLFVITIRDDGRGLDYDAIRRRGVQRGLLAPNDAPTREELAQLIFQPGFSTRDTADQLAGRGVGMDVVAATLDKLRGWLEVTSIPGQGTTIRLRFPLPSVIQHAMVFRCGNQHFALPMESVQAAGELNSEQQQAPRVQMPDMQEEVNRANLAILIASDHAIQSKASALCVDEIIGPEELVVRSLPRMLRHHPFCTAAATSCSGQTVLLLDAREFLNSQRPAEQATQAQATAEFTSSITICRTKPRVLVVDDSLSSRKRVVRSLSRFNVETVEAVDGKQALKLLSQRSFDAVFSDMEMPNLDGFGLLEKSKALLRNNTPPVVIISSRNEDEFTEKAYGLGAKDYLIKPLADTAMDATLSKIESLRHLTTETL